MLHIAMTDPRYVCFWLENSPCRPCALHADFALTLSTLPEVLVFEVEHLCNSP